MELLIDKESTVNDLQMQFNALYPYLKLQFAKSRHGEDKNSIKFIKTIPEIPGKKLGIIHYPVNVSVEKNVTVAQLLKDFEDIGLQVQVCRKSGNQWVETSLTADWTLERQNTEAMLIIIHQEKPH
jgi:hypothetical protein